MGISWFAGNSPNGSQSEGTSPTSPAKKAPSS